MRVPRNEHAEDFCGDPSCNLCYHDVEDPVVEAPVEVSFDDLMARPATLTTAPCTYTGEIPRVDDFMMCDPASELMREL